MIALKIKSQPKDSDALHACYKSSLDHKITKNSVSNIFRSLLEDYKIFKVYSQVFSALLLLYE